MAENGAVVPCVPSTQSVRHDCSHTKYTRHPLDWLQPSTFIPSIMLIIDQINSYLIKLEIEAVLFTKLWSLP